MLPSGHSLETPPCLPFGECIHYLSSFSCLFQYWVLCQLLMHTTATWQCKFWQKLLQDVTWWPRGFTFLTSFSVSFSETLSITLLVWTSLKFYFFLKATLDPPTFFAFYPHSAPHHQPSYFQRTQIKYVYLLWCGRQLVRWRPWPLLWSSCCCVIPTPECCLHLVSCFWQLQYGKSDGMPLWV